MQNSTDRILIWIYHHSHAVGFMVVNNFIIKNMNRHWKIKDNNKREQSVMYDSVINKYESKNINVYYEIEKYFYLHHNGTTKLSHSCHYKIVI